MFGFWLVASLFLALEQINRLSAWKRSREIPFCRGFGIGHGLAYQIHARERTTCVHGGLLHFNHEVGVWLLRHTDKGVVNGFLRDRKIGFTEKHVGGKVDGWGRGIIHWTYRLTGISQKARKFVTSVRSFTIPTPVANKRAPVKGLVVLLLETLFNRETRHKPALFIG